jgi:L-aminopeptidase/D-esterase-like protein
MARNNTSVKNITKRRASVAKRNRHTRSSAGSLIDVPGIRVGHAHNLDAQTGCTVVLCEADGAVAGVDVRGAAPGTRETDLLEPGNLVERVHAVVLTGGSVFGLDAACGVVHWLEERGVGFDVGVARVPIVPAAVIFDLAVGDPSVRPDYLMGYEACEGASAQTVAEGRTGVGAGATVGKILGLAMASPGGVGTASMKLPSGVTIGVLVVVNAFGDIIDPSSGHILTGACSPRSGWLDTQRAIEQAGFAGDTGKGKTSKRAAPRGQRDAARHPFSGIENTTLAVVATDAALTKAQAKKVATMAHDGFARAIRPVHTMFDGDTIFALSTGGLAAEVTTIGAVAADLVARAIVRVGQMSGTRKS